MKTNLTIEQVRQLSSTDLRTIASELGIKNYSRFTKDQLQRKVIETIQLQASEVPSDEQSTINTEDEKEIITISTLKTMVEATIEGFIESKQTSLYTKAMETLGGSYDSDLDDLLEVATVESLEAVLNITVPAVTVTPKKEKAAKKEKVIKAATDKTAPRPGSKSEQIYNYLLANPDMSIYKVSQQFDTYYSVVERILKVYIKK